jgi:radical SAM superfamily enzyme YgiQ (UPF0313 family)
MKPRFILINPWIYDFAAVNMWARPLGLLKVAEYLSQYDVDLKLIDCTDILRKRKNYGMGKYPRQIVERPEILKTIPKNYARYGIKLEDFAEAFESQLPCDLVFITSIMSYWYPGVNKAVEVIRSLSPNTPAILGGIYATLYQTHASNNSGADYIFKGYIDNPRVPPVRRGREERPSVNKMETLIQDLGFELNKKNKPMPYYKLDLYKSYPFAPVLTSAGCPYKCTYCASSSLFEGFVQREPSHIINEIEELYNMGMRDYAFYDDALLINADTHLKVVLKEVISSDFNVRFHCPNGIHARFIDDELAYLMKRSGFTTLRLGLETVNSERQSRTGGKITSDIFKSAVKNLKRHGFSKEHIGVYLMYGFPGQGLEEVREGVEFLKDLEVRINLTEFSPIPGTLCWQELKSMGIISDNIDPLLTNNSVFSFLFSGYEFDEIEKLKLEVKEHNSSC